MPPSLNDRLQSLLGTAFRLDRELTGGGMSRVFVAHEPALKREVVVKVLPPDLVTRESVARFEREVAVTAQLQHPHILPIITTGGADDIYYYVAPYIHGESLRARLGKDGKIPFDEAIRLVSELLGAVGFAHARGIIHRDIKPGNILLAEGHAILADFGIARALAGPDDGRLTMTGGAMGTPSYMAPEHPRDEQADLYAVAVVAHEMLTGALPRGRGDISRTTSEIATAVSREATSRAKGVAAVLARAMSIDATKRFRTAREFRDALEGAAARAGTRRATVALIATAAVLGGVAIWQAVRPPKPVTAPSPAGTLLAVFPPNKLGSDSIAAGGDELAQRLSAAIEGWSDVHVLAPGRVREALGAKPTITRGDVEAAARLLGVDRAVTGAIGRRGDTVTFTASLQLVDDGSAFRTLVATFVPGTPSETRELRRLASALFRDGTELPWTDTDSNRQASLVAWMTYDSARTRMRVWALGDAERLLLAAVAVEPRLTQAHLELAHVQRWLRDQNLPVGQQEAASAALAEGQRDRLSVYDAHLAQGIAALSSGRFTEACAAYRDAVRLDAARFAGWFGLVECQVSDNFVVPDARSPTGYRFRTSRWGTIATFDSAIARIAGSRPPFVYSRLQRAMVIEPNLLRTGRDSRGRLFAAQLETSADSTVHWPRDVAAMGGDAPGASVSTSDALMRMRARVRPLFVSWVKSDPRMWESHDALARLLESTGTIASPATDGFSALDEVRQARALNPGDTTAELARTQVRLLLKSGQMSEARRVAVSTLNRWSAPNYHVADRLLGLAALIGDTERTVMLWKQLSATASRGVRDASGTPAEVSPAILESRAEFLARAATGTCGSNVREAPARIIEMVRAFYSSREQSPVLLHSLLADPIMLALPCIGVNATSHLDSTHSSRIAIAQLLAAGRFPAARMRFDAYVAGRDVRRAEFLSMDAVLQDAWLSVMVGDSAGARSRLQHALVGLPSMPPALINRESIAAAIPRAIRLFSELSAAAGDAANAVFWRAAADTLTGRSP